MFAAQGGHAAVAEVLLRKGAEPRVTDMVSDLPVVFCFSVNATNTIAAL